MSSTLQMMKVPYVDLALQHKGIKKEILSAVEKVIEHGVFIVGPEVQEFEKEFAKVCPVQEIVALNSGTDALIFALKALGIGPGDEVITPPNSFVASTSCIRLVGAQPVFCDVGEDYNLNPSLLPKLLSPRTKAIIPVHLTGRPAPMKEIMAFAKKHRLFVIEDAAQAVGAEYEGKPVGSLGDVGCFSLHPLKTLNACGDGGVLTTNSSEIAEKVRLYRNLGLKTRENCVVWSSNSRLDTMQAAILLVKLKYLNKWNVARRKNAALYHQGLKGIKEIRTPVEKPYEKSVYHTFVVLAERRDELKNFLQSVGVGTAIHYPLPIHKQDVAKELQADSYPNTEYQAQRIISLPIHQDLAEEQIAYVIEQIKNFYQA